MLHAKTVTIDGVRSRVGTSRDNEINAIVLSHSFGDQMNLMFQSDLENSSEIMATRWDCPRDLLCVDYGIFRTFPTAHRMVHSSAPDKAPAHSVDRLLVFLGSKNRDLIRAAGKRRAQIVTFVATRKCC
jgi:hypothetical protein